eukprot:1195657-Prorocentrum_minimum.AAC.2
MLLCDGCDRGFHMYCLPNPVTEIPEDNWYCPACLGEPNPAKRPTETWPSISVGTTRRRNYPSLAWSKKEGV